MNANRMIVFRALKRYMDRHHRCPTSEEVSALTGLSKSACHKHMKALDGADGLQIPITHRAGIVARGFFVNPSRHTMDPHNAPVDRLMA